MLFIGQITLTTAFNASRVLINPNIEAAEEFKRKQNFYFLKFIY